MVVDPVNLAAFAAPLLAKGAEAFTKTAGERLGGKMVDLCQAVVEKFKGDCYAEQTLSRANEIPESDERQLALKGILAEKMKEDPDFEELIGMLLDELKSETSSSHAIFDQRGQSVGTQTNIGNVQGTVNIGPK